MCFNRTVRFSSGQLWFPDEVDQYSQVVSLPSQKAACCMLCVHDGWCHGSKVLGVEWTSGSSLSSIAAPPGSLYISSNSPVSPLSSSHWPPTHFPPAGIFVPLGGQSSPRQSNDQPHTRTQRPPLDWQPNYPAWEWASRSAVPQLTGSEGRLSSSPSRSTPLCIFLPVSAVCVYVCVRSVEGAL